MIARVPIRWRLALAFAAAMAGLLLAAGLFLHISLDRSLEAGVEQSLRIRSDEVSALVRDGAGRSLGDSRARVSDPDESFAQLLDADGRVLDASSALLRAPLIGGDIFSRAQAGVVLQDAASIPGADGRSRLLARPVVIGGQRRVVVIVGLSLEARDEAIAGLDSRLAIVGPVALLVASLLGYALAAAALRPVEVLRRGAAEISGSDTGSRLPVPVARDELRDLSETLNQMLERIDQALRRERDFVADAGHELRTPVAILKAEIDLALSGERSADELLAALVSAREEVDLLARLSNDLLALAGAERANAAPLREPIDAGEILEDVRRRFLARARAEDRAITVDATQGLTFAGERSRIAEALGNLVENALRHGSGEIHLRALPHGAGVDLSVADEGPGIDPDFAGRAFDRFTQNRPSVAPREGAGLGLPIVRATARAHGGDAAIDVGADGGARVTMRLP